MTLSTWKQYPCCSECRKTITRITKQIGHSHQRNRSIVDWCRLNCEPTGNDKEAFVTQDPFIWSDIDHFTLFVDPQELDNAIFQYEEGFISQIEEKDLSPTWIDEDAVVEAVEAEPIVEAVVAEPVVENNDMFKRPTKKVEDVIDLSKPEIQDAEMVDDED